MPAVAPVPGNAQRKAEVDREKERNPVASKNGFSLVMSERA